MWLRHILFYGRGALLAITALVLAVAATLSMRSFLRQPDRPLFLLPSRIDAPDGRLTLYADFGSASAGTVPVYLVNRTSNPVILGSEEGDFCLKQEFLDQDGRWVRAEPHLYSWCRNLPYDPPTLPPGRYCIIRGAFPSTGERAKIRYRLYSSPELHALESNVADGWIDRTKVAEAAIDIMAIRYGDFDFVRRVALGAIQPLKEPTHEIYDPRMRAIYELGSDRFPRKEADPVLETIEAERETIYADEAKQMLEWTRTRKHQAQVTR